MCMALTNFSHRIRRVRLFKPLVVYKVMRDNHVGLASPHQRSRYKLNEEQRTKITFSEITEYDNWCYSGDHIGKIVEEGFHAFVKYEDAVAQLKRMNGEFYDRQVSNPYRTSYKYYPSHNLIDDTLGVYECHIPRGATYFRGLWENLLPKKVENIVSDRIVIVKKIEA